MSEDNRIIIDLSEKTKNIKIDSVSGRKEGRRFAEDLDVLNKLKKGSKFKVVIDKEKISTINNSFWKGFFSEIMKHYRKREVVESLVTIEASEFIRENVKENLSILESIFNA